MSSSALVRPVLSGCWSQQTPSFSILYGEVGSRLKFFDHTHKMGYLPVFPMEVRMVSLVVFLTTPKSIYSVQLLSIG